MAKKVGRPKKEIDYKTVEKLASIHCTQEEIADYMNISVRTLQRNAEFCRIYKRGLSLGKSSLRRMQWKKAEEGNTTALIWLGKQMLGQRDNPEVDQTDKAVEAIQAFNAAVQSEGVKSRDATE